MRIEELTAVSFGEARQFTLTADTADQATAFRVAEFLTYVIDGKLAEGRLSPENPAHGILRIKTDSGDALRIERKTVLDEVGARKETLSVTDASQNELGSAALEALFPVDASVFEALISLGTSAPMPEHLTEFCRILLDAQASREELAHAVRRIDEVSASLLRPNRKGGAIYELEKQLAELQKALDASDFAARRTNELSEEHRLAKAERESLDGDFEKLLELESAYGNLSLIREYDRLHEIENDLDRELCAYDGFLSEHRVGTFLPTKEYRQEIAALQEKVTESVRTYTEGRAALDELESIKPDQKALAHIELAQKEYRGFGAVRAAARLLFRRQAHTSFFSCLALFAAAFFAVCTLLTGKENFSLSMTLLMLTLCCTASSFVLLFSRRRFANALLILCRQFEVKNYNELIARLRFLESEDAMGQLRQKSIAGASERFERNKRDCASALEALNETTRKWGRCIDSAHAQEDFDRLLADLDTFLAKDRAFQARIAEKRRFVSLARKQLSDQSEVAVRALVPPAKRKNLRRLEDENRIADVAQGVAFYRSRIETLDHCMAALDAEHAEWNARIGDPLTLRRDYDLLYERIAHLKARYHSYLLIKKALISRTEHAKEGRFPYDLYRAAIKAEEDSGEWRTLCAYLSLGEMLLSERLPLAVNTSALKEESVLALRTLCAQQNRALFCEKAE